jgi:hypothetical protein
MCRDSAYSRWQLNKIVPQLMLGMQNVIGLGLGLGLGMRLASIAAWRVMLNMMLTLDRIRNSDKTKHKQPHQILAHLNIGNWTFAQKGLCTLGFARQHNGNGTAVVLVIVSEPVFTLSNGTAVVLVIVPEPVFTLITNSYTL